MGIFTIYDRYLIFSLVSLVRTALNHPNVHIFIYLNVQLCSCISNYTLYIAPTTYTEAGDMLNVLFGTPCNQVYLDLCTNKRVYSRQTCLHQDSGRSRTVYMYIVRHSNVA